jgi:hypothetical protein
VRRGAGSPTRTDLAGTDLVLHDLVMRDLGTHDFVMRDLVMRDLGTHGPSTRCDTPSS